MGRFLVHASKVSMTPLGRVYKKADSEPCTGFPRCHCKATTALHLPVIHTQSLFVCQKAEYQGVIDLNSASRIVVQ